MSDADNIVQFPGATATDTLVPQSVKAVIGSGEDAVTFTIATFCLSKTLRTFALLTALAASVGLNEAVSAAGASKEAGEFENAVAPGFIARALAILPKALVNGVPDLYRLLGLFVTPNRKLRELDENGEDIDGYLLAIGRDIAYSGTNEQVINLVIQSIKVIGIETILKTMPLLTTLLSGAQS